jgi:enoyl-CoA hydratase
MEYQILQHTVDGAVATITVARPKALNALNTRFFDEMDALLDELSGNAELRVVIITGEGKAFAAGADIAEMSGMNSKQGEAFSRKGQAVFNKIENYPLPVIAAVNGYALGGGCEFAASCDIRIASAKAKFGQPEVNLGLIPGYSGSQRLPRLIGRANANYLLFTGDTIDAAEAHRMGLVQKVIDHDLLMEEALKTAKTIASKGPEAVKMLKKTVNEGLATSFDKGEDLEAKHFGSLFGTKETTEGMDAFLNKRKPNW